MSYDCLIPEKMTFRTSQDTRASHGAVETLNIASLATLFANCLMALTGQNFLVSFCRNRYNRLHTVDTPQVTIFTTSNSEFSLKPLNSV
jgi:hypothetical protein